MEYLYYVINRLTGEIVERSNDLAYLQKRYKSINFDIRENTKYYE